MNKSNESTAEKRAHVKYSKEHLTSEGIRPITKMILGWVYWVDYLKMPKINKLRLSKMSGYYVRTIYRELQTLHGLGIVEFDSRPQLHDFIFKLKDKAENYKIVHIDLLYTKIMKNSTKEMFLLLMGAAYNGKLPYTMSELSDKINIHKETLRPHIKKLVELKLLIPATKKKIHSLMGYTYESKVYVIDETPLRTIANKAMAKMILEYKIDIEL